MLLPYRLEMRFAGVRRLRYRRISIPTKHDYIPTVTSLSWKLPTGGESHSPQCDKKPSLLLARRTNKSSIKQLYTMVRERVYTMRVFVCESGKGMRRYMLFRVSICCTKMNLTVSLTQRFSRHHYVWTCHMAFAARMRPYTVSRDLLTILISLPMDCIPVDRLLSSH